MAVGLCSHVMLVACFIAHVTTRSTQGHFPLKDCKDDKIDILSLLDDFEDTWVHQWESTHLLGLHLFNSKSREPSSQYMMAAVIDQFSDNNDNIDFSDWSFHEMFNPVPYTRQNTDYLEIPIANIKVRLEIKIQFVERLFGEMRGVRDSAIHVGIVFLDGSNLTTEEIRQVSSIVQERNGDVMIFVVIFGSPLTEHIVHLTDTIVLKNIEMGNSGTYLLMAMCKMCPKDAYLFEEKTIINRLSCFRIERSKETVQLPDSVHYCNKEFGGNLAVIETVKEMMFLKKLFQRLIKEFRIVNGHFLIGLRRDLSSYAKPFQWVTAPGKYRPLLIDNWLADETRRESTNTDCVAWEFTNNWTDDFIRFLSQTSTPDEYLPREGWVKINCNFEIMPLKLCEVALLRTVNKAEVMSNWPVPVESNNSIFEKGHFVIHETHIKSMSANVGNPNFLTFLRVSNKDFPIFDCGEDAAGGRYISYSMVCDFFNHCSNKRDEMFCLNPRELLSINETYMFCTSGQKLMGSVYKCDNVKDCRDGSDEEKCLNNYCRSVHCHDGSCLPPTWLNDGAFDCFIYNNKPNNSLVSDEQIYITNNNNCSLTCNRDICIGKSQLNDGVKDCIGPEGPLDETIGKLEPANTCRNRFGHFIWAPKCHYITDRYGGIIGCRDMSHLRDCENFECGHGYVKCYKSYCIPQRYLHDGKADCPTGEDENLFYTGPCTGYFACWNSSVCLHPDLVCDGHPDCPEGDDELDCLRFCPAGFRCIAGTVTASDYNRSVPLDMSSLPAVDSRTRYLDLSGVDLHNFQEATYRQKEMFINLKVLILSKCNISELLYADYGIGKRMAFMIQKLDISYNRLKIFTEFDFSYTFKHLNFLNLSYNSQLKFVRNLRFSLLEILDLSYTSILHLNNSVFAKLPKLKHLNVSHTLISDFSGNYFSKQHTLQTLDLRGINTEYFDDYSFHGLTISQMLYADHFQICCPQIPGLVIKSHSCIAPEAAISSCFNLLGLDVQRYLLWLVAILAVLGNLTVIVYRFIWDRLVLKTGYGLFVTNLSISDFIMGVYLFIIAGADNYYSDNYVLHDKNWRNSVVCKIAGFMACLSCEVSTLFVFLITLDRFLVMKYPFGQLKCSRCHTTTAVFMSWVASFLLSLVPIVFSFDIYTSNAMCLGLPLTNTQAKGWEYSVGVFIFYNLIMFLLIAYGQHAIFRAMSENRISKTTTSMSRSRRVKDIAVAKQLSLVVVSNFLCWFPIGLMGLMSFGGHEINNEVYAWTTVLLLPINSAANPVLYTIPAIMAKWEKFKHGDQRTLSPST